MKSCASQRDAADSVHAPFGARGTRGGRIAPAPGTLTIPGAGLPARAATQGACPCSPVPLAATVRSAWCINWRCTSPQHVRGLELPATTRPHRRRRWACYFIRDGNVIVAPDTANRPRPRWCRVCGFLQAGSTQAMTTSSTKKSWRLFRRVWKTRAFEAGVALGDQRCTHDGGGRGRDAEGREFVHVAARCIAALQDLRHQFHGRNVAHAFTRLRQCREAEVVCGSRRSPPAAARTRASCAMTSSSRRAGRCPSW